MGNVVSIFPANSFSVVADSAKLEVVAGVVIGYDMEGALCVYGGGMIDGRQPTAKDWLWMVESFKSKLMAGYYSSE